jgi:hypothetical protein
MGTGALDGLHLAVLHLRSSSAGDAEAALSYLRTLLPDATAVGVPPSGTGALVQSLLRRPTLTRWVETRREMLVSGFAIPHQGHLEQLLSTYVEADADLDTPTLHEALIPRLADLAHSDHHLGAIAWTMDVAVAVESMRQIRPLLQLLVQFGRRHPLRLPPHPPGDRRAPGP